MVTRRRLRYPFKGVAIHHIDGDPGNNDIANIQLVNTRTSGPLTPEQCREIDAWRRRQNVIDEMKP